MMLMIEIIMTHWKVIIIMKLLIPNTALTSGSRKNSYNAKKRMFGIRINRRMESITQLQTTCITLIDVPLILDQTTFSRLNKDISLMPLHCWVHFQREN